MASAHRLVAELVKNDVLIKDSSGKLSVGMRLWEITAMSSVVQTLREASLPQMQWAMARLNYPILLSTLDGYGVVNIETLTPPGPSPINITHPGIRLPVLASSSGMVLLAFAEDPATAKHALAEAPITRFTDDTPADRSQLAQLVEATRIHGQIVVRRWMWPESGAVAVPIFGPNGSGIGALSATIPCNAARASDVARILKTAAHAISAHLKRTPLPTDPYLTAFSTQVKRITGQRS
jgi:DNA-binding IclR family transcriptional regulator